MDQQPTTPASEKPVIVIDREFEMYCNMVYGASFERMPPNQLLEIKRAFFGGMSTAYVRLVADTSNPAWTDEDVTIRLKTIEDALNKYWHFEQQQQQKSRIIT